MNIFFKREYPSDYACESYFDGDYQNFAILGNSELKEVGNEDIINLYNHLDDIVYIIERNENGEYYNLVDFIGDLNYYACFTTEALKEYNQNITSDNLNAILETMKEYTKNYDVEETIASLLSIITNNNYVVRSIAGCVQRDWNYIVLPENCEEYAENYASAYFGTGEEVYNNIGEWYFIDIPYAQDSDIQEWLYDNVGDDAILCDKDDASETFCSIVYDALENSSDLEVEDIATWEGNKIKFTFEGVTYNLIVEVA